MPIDSDTRKLLKNLIGCVSVATQNQGLTTALLAKNLPLEPEHQEQLQQSAEASYEMARMLREASDAL